MAQLSRETRQACLFALQEAARFGHSRIEPEHLLLGLVRADPEIAQELLSIGLPAERLRLLVGSTPSDALDIPAYSRATRQLIAHATTPGKDEVVTPKMLLLAITGQSQSQACKLLKATGEFERLLARLS